MKTKTCSTKSNATCTCTGGPASWQEGSDSELCSLEIPDFQLFWQFVEEFCFYYECIQAAADTCLLHVCASRTRDVPGSGPAA